MGTVHPFAHVRSFDPDTLQIMGVALDCAWYKLLASGSALSASWRAEHTREALASQIVASAQLGERDLDRLCDLRADRCPKPGCRAEQGFVCAA